MSEVQLSLFEIDDLQSLFEAQRSLMSRLGIGIDSSLNASEKIDAITGLVEESSEVLRGVRHSKIPWRHSDIENEVFIESIDVLFYLLELWILSGRTQKDVVLQYRKKYIKNIERLNQNSLELK